LNLEKIIPDFLWSLTVNAKLASKALIKEFTFTGSICGLFSLLIFAHNKRENWFPLFSIFKRPILKRFLVFKWIEYTYHYLTVASPVELVFYWSRIGGRTTIFIWDSSNTTQRMVLTHRTSAPNYRPMKGWTAGLAGWRHINLGVSLIFQIQTTELSFEPATYRLGNQVSNHCAKRPEKFIIIYVFFRINYPRQICALNSNFVIYGTFEPMWSCGAVVRDSVS